MKFLNLFFQYFFNSRKRKDSYSESYIVGRYASGYWLNLIIAETEKAQSLESATEIVFRKSLFLGSATEKLMFRISTPFRLYFHPDVDLQVYHYKRRYLGNYAVKNELLMYKGKFCAAIYFLDTSINFTDIKDALKLKYVVNGDSLNTFENTCFTDINNNQLFFLKTEFSTLLVYTIRGFFESLAQDLDEKMTLKNRLLEQKILLDIVRDI